MKKDNPLLGDRPNDEEDSSLIDFPEKFPIKVFGQDTQAFAQSVRQIVDDHVDTVHVLDWQTNNSRRGTYLAITVTILAQSQAQLDAIYIDLTSSPLVKMAL
ncbi:MAG: hypothetical protein CSA45_02580 [Gammaproteobacteria bacterium]|nr:MAG: hypothetical protein CSA45_02580 [Gammaproteobacteria bacterium]